MSSFPLSRTFREVYRKDFDPQFLKDLVDQGAQHGDDPYNRIGLNCGHNNPRAYQIWQDRAIKRSTPIMLKEQAE